MLRLEQIHTDGGTQPRAYARRVRRLNIKGRSCYACGLDYAPVLNLHHIRPLREGGNNAAENLVFLCPTCHALVHKAISLLLSRDGAELARKRKRAQEFYTWLFDRCPPRQLDRILELMRKRSEVRL